MMSLKGTTTGKNFFDAVSEAVEKMGLKWDKICGVTTDGALAMTGERKGMASMVCVKVKESRGEAVRIHCIIHQEALCAKTVQLRDVMNTVVKTVTIIRARGLYQSCRTWMLNMGMYSTTLMCAGSADALCRSGFIR